MNVLVACECSGRVRDAFTQAGHFAMSADLLPSSSPGPHYCGNVLDILENNWDLLIAHPPCTYLSYAGNSAWQNPGRSLQRAEALLFVAKLWEANIPGICIENPNGLLSTFLHKPTQTIQPYYFGEPHLKTTNLWLRGLPKLFSASCTDLFNPGTRISKPEPLWTRPSGKKVHFTGATDTKSSRAGLRSVTFSSIAQAMAAQWG